MTNVTGTDAEANLRKWVDKFTNLATKAAKVKFKNDLDEYHGELFDAMHGIIREFESAMSIPNGYPECTGAIVRAMSQKQGRVLIRKMHADENLIESQARRIKDLVDEKHRIQDEFHKLNTELIELKRKKK